jgi:hypothetical protein
MPSLVELQQAEGLGSESNPHYVQRQKIVIVGLGMVAISLMYEAHLTSESSGRILIFAVRKLSSKTQPNDTIS